MNTKLAYVLSGSMLFLQPTLLLAQAAPPTEGPSPSSYQLEEVVVTARKRDESLERVPVAVAVIGQDQLHNSIAANLTELAELAPQVSMGQGGAGTGAVITIRGISSGSNDSGLDQSVAVEVDGIPISRGQIISAATFDLRQVQVLEGPQALFFGKNSPAGVISLQSANPTNTFEAYVTPGYEFEANERFVEAAVSGPLSDTVKARLAFRGSRMGGWIQDVATPLPDFINPAFTDPGATQGNELNAESRYAARLTLMWTPTDDFDATFKLTKNTQRTNGGNTNSEPFCFNGTTVPTLLAAYPGGLPLPGADCQKNQVVSISAAAPQYAVNFPYGNNGVPDFRSDFTLASLTANQRFDKIELTSTTGYYAQTVTDTTSSDWSPYDSIWFAGREGYSLYTQEFRVNSSFDAPVNFMAGLYYEHFDRPFFNAPDLFHAFNPTADNYTTTNVSALSHGHYISGFAQARWNIIPTLEFAAGARYSHDQKDSSITNTSFAPGYVNGVLVPNPYGLRAAGDPLVANYSSNNVSPEATLSWHPQPDQTLYVAYKTGYKAGGISTGFLVGAALTPDNVKFAPEKTRGEEIGFKTSMLDHRLRFDITAYDYKYQDLQVASYNATTISFNISNAAVAKIRGIEGTAEWLVLPGLTLRGNAGFNHARYDSYSNAQCYEGQSAAEGCVDGVQDLSGKPLLRAPNLTYSLGADYKWTLATRWTADVSITGNHTGTYQSAADYSPGGIQDAFWLLDASARVTYDEKYDIAFLGRDLTNSYYTLNTNGWSGSQNPNQYVGFFNRPRELVLEVTARF